MCIGRTCICASLEDGVGVETRECGKRERGLVVALAPGIEILPENFGGMPGRSERKLESRITL